MSEELAVINQPTALGPVAPVEDLSGLADIKSKPGNIVLLQPTSRELYGGKPGQFLDTFDNSVYDTIDVIPLRTTKGRVYFKEGSMDFSMGPLCKSNDGKVPSPFVQVPQASKCGDFVNGEFKARCPKAMWGPKDPITKKSAKPACGDTRLLFMLVKDTLMPAFLNVKSTSIKTYELGINKIKKDIAINEQKGLKLNFHDYYFTLKATKAKDGNWYYLEIDSIKRVIEPGQYNHLFNEYVVQYKAAADADNEYTGNENTVENAVGAVVDAKFVEPTYQAA